LGAELVGHGVTARFIFRIHVVAEGRRLEVIGDGGVVGLQGFQLTGDDVGQAVQSVGGNPVLGGQKADAVKGTIEDAVSVNTEESFHEDSFEGFKIIRVLYHFTQKKSISIRDFMHFLQSSVCGFGGDGDLPAGAKFIRIPAPSADFDIF
jgi:hypothetical protein